MRLPAGQHVIDLLRRQKLLILRFVVTSLGRTGLAIASVFLRIIGSALLLTVTFSTRSTPATATLTITMNMISSIRLMPRCEWVAAYPRKEGAARRSPSGRSWRRQRDAHRR